MIDEIWRQGTACQARIVFVLNEDISENTYLRIKYDIHGNSATNTAAIVKIREGYEDADGKLLSEVMEWGDSYVTKTFDLKWGQYDRGQAITMFLCGSNADAKVYMKNTVLCGVKSPVRGIWSQIPF